MTEDFKAKGNAALQSGKVNEAIQFYTEALKLDPNNHVLFSNRSAAYAKSKNYTEALSDADKCIAIKPDWAKGYSRKGAALEFLSRLQEAKEAYEHGLKLEPNNDQIRNSLSNLKEELFAGNGESSSMDNIFSDPGLKTKIENNPHTRDYMKDKSFLTKLDLLQKNPQLISSFIQDKKILDVMAVAMGLNPGNIKMAENMDTSPPSSPQPKKQENKKDEVLFTDNQKASLAEKELGNNAYKKKDFDTAISHYDKAIELEPTNISLYTNKSAVFFETQKYKECIEICDQAVEIGRENKADFKLIAKAYARAANAYVKLENLALAQKYFTKSLCEFRDPTVLKKSHEVDKLIRDKKNTEYINPEMAEQEKNKGNELFQAGKYPDAMKHYTEAIKRNSSDPKLYSNRAACFTKLMEFPSALKDCDKCIELDPKFLKGYLRKGACLTAMKEMGKAADAYRRAMEIDSSCQEAIDGFYEANKGVDPEEARKRAMQDPEIQEILSNPAMQIILEQMQKDRGALQEHLKNPEIASKIRKLIQAGLIMVR